MRRDEPTTASCSVSLSPMSKRWPLILGSSAPSTSRWAMTSATSAGRQVRRPIRPSGSLSRDICGMTKRTTWRSSQALRHPMSAPVATRSRTMRREPDGPWIARSGLVPRHGPRAFDWGRLLASDDRACRRRSKEPVAVRTTTLARDGLLDAAQCSSPDPSGDGTRSGAAPGHQPLNREPAGVMHARRRPDDETSSWRCCVTRRRSIPPFGGGARRAAACASTILRICACRPIGTMVAVEHR